MGICVQRAVTRCATSCAGPCRWYANAVGIVRTGTVLVASMRERFASRTGPDMLSVVTNPVPHRPIVAIATHAIGATIALRFGGYACTLVRGWCLSGRMSVGVYTETCVTACVMIVTPIGLMGSGDAMLVMYATL